MGGFKKEKKSKASFLFAKCTDELKTEIDVYCARNRINLNKFIQIACAKEIGYKGEVI